MNDVAGAQNANMQLTGDDVAHVAHLARLSVKQEQLNRYAKDLSAILEYVGQLKEFDTTKVETAGQASGLANVLQPDVPNADKIVTVDFLRGAPAVEPPYLKVKAVLE